MASPKISVVLIPGAAAPAGINAIKSLRMARYKGKIVATDSSYLSAGFFMSDFNEVIPEADDRLFVERLLGIIKRHKVQVLMPTSGFDIYPYSENRERLLEMGVHAIVSDRKSLEICRDKMQTYQYLRHDFSVPETTDEPGHVEQFPIIAKPRFGKGSRGIMKIDDESELKYISSKMNDLIYQEFLPGTEYTIDVLSDLNEKPLIAVPRIRIQTKAGISTKGKIVRDIELEENCLEIARCIRIRGPCCIQMKESSEGTLKLVEVNPRMGGGTIFSTLAGVNFPSLLLDLIEDKEIVIPKISEVTIIRYFEEIVIRNEERKDFETGMLPKPNYLA
ncbi:MAG: ATP-grasp domain-containing protein [Nitrososphaeraceae archaeon]